MSSWDVFHSERLEVLRGLSPEEIRAALAAGSLRDDDLARPAGTNDPWARLDELPGLIGPAPAAPAPEPPPEPTGVEALHAPLGEDDDDAPPPTVVLATPGPLSPAPPDAPEPPSAPDISDGGADVVQEPYDPQEEDEEAAEFTLAPTSRPEMEQMDLTAMVDVAFQLILFFLVTATTIYFKTLEVPRPNPEQDRAAAVEPRTIDDLESDYILVGIDPAGAFTIDREPVAASAAAIAARLRQARAESGRTAMLLTAESTALHRYAVLAYDAANEVGLRIAIARPTRPDTTPPPPP